MAEPAGLMYELKIDESEIVELLAQPIWLAGSEVQVGAFLAQIWKTPFDPGREFLFCHYDPAARSLYICWMIRHFQTDIQADFAQLLPILTRFADAGDVQCGVISTFPEADRGLALSGQDVVWIDSEFVPPSVVEFLSNRFWEVFELCNQSAPEQAIQIDGLYHAEFAKYTQAL